jgi:hypothetical protein
VITDGADRRVVQETEAAKKKDGEKKNVLRVLHFAIIEGGPTRVSVSAYTFPETLSGNFLVDICHPYPS